MRDGTANLQSAKLTVAQTAKIMNVSVRMVYMAKELATTDRADLVAQVDAAAERTPPARLFLGAELVRLRDQCSRSFSQIESDQDANLHLLGASVADISSAFPAQNPK